MVEVPASVLSTYRYWSLYNSPYAAHDRGCAIDLYPEYGTAPSPVAGEVLDTRTVQAPPKPYAPEHDHLIVIDTAEAAGDALPEQADDRSSYSMPDDEPTYSTPDGESAIARILHVDPAVDPGDQVQVGDDLGTLVRAGFFAPWVENHLHLGFRSRDANPYRASGSLRIDPGVDVVALDWDGTGTVVEAGETYALLDEPIHADPGTTFAGIEADGGGVLDGGLTHYDGGGLLGVHDGTANDAVELLGDPDATANSPVSLLGTTVGHRNGRTVEWTDLTVLVNGDPITGLSLCCSQTAEFGAKLICPDREIEEGTAVTVDIQ